MREDRCSSSPEYSLSQHIEMRKRREEANKSTLLEPTSPVGQGSSKASTARSGQSVQTTASKYPTPSRSTSPTLKAGTQTSSEELEVVYCTSPTLPKKSNPKSVQGDSSDTGTSSLSSDQDRPQSCSSNPYGLPPPPSTETIKRFIEKRFGKRSSHGHHSPNVGRTVGRQDLRSESDSDARRERSDANNSGTSDAYNSGTSDAYNSGTSEANNSGTSDANSSGSRGSASGRHRKKRRRSWTYFENAPTECPVLLLVPAWAPIPWFTGKSTKRSCNCRCRESHGEG